MRTTAENPTGLLPFDHRPLVQLPEYAAARRAIDDLIHAIRREEIEFPQAHFIEACGDMAASSAFADSCDVCDDLPLIFPHRAVVVHGGVEADYVCPVDGNRWSTSWALKLPDL